MSEELIDRILSETTLSTDSPLQVSALFKNLEKELQSENPDLEDIILDILETLKQNPELKKTVLPDDQGLLVKAIRRSAAFIVEHKSEKSINRFKKAKAANDFSASFNNILKADDFDLDAFEKSIREKQNSVKKVVL